MATQLLSKTENFKKIVYVDMFQESMIKHISEDPNYLEL